MKVKINIPGFTSKEIIVQSGFLFSVPKLFVNGKRVRRNRYKNCMIEDDDGKIRAIKMEYRLFDPLPVLSYFENPIEYTSRFSFLEQFVMCLPFAVIFSHFWAGILLGLLSRYFGPLVLRSHLVIQLKYVLLLFSTVLLIILHIVVFVDIDYNSLIHMPGAAKKCFWKINNNGTSVYLLGAIDLNSLSVYPLEPEINRVFENADVLVIGPSLNITRDVGAKTKAIRIAQYKGKKTITDTVSKDIIEALEKNLGDNQVVITNYKRYKPWFVAMVLESVQLNRLGYQANFQMDRYYITKSIEVSKKKKIIEIESVKELFAYYEGLDNSDHELMLRHAINGSYRNSVNLKLIYSLWSLGLSESIDSVIRKGFPRPYGRLYHLLIENRAAKYSNTIMQWLNNNSGEQTYFIVLDVKFLAGKKGILQLLQDKGFHVEQL